MPTIGMKLNETYTFLQQDRSNWYHPLGFAYYPDGAHDGKDELEPSIVPPNSSSTCDVTLSCPKPMYYSNPDTFLGSGNGTEDFGLDVYEPLFFRPIPEWTGLGNFSVQVRFDDASYTQDLFYFCHVSIYILASNVWVAHGTFIDFSHTLSFSLSFYFTFL